MNTATLRGRLHEYIDRADKELLYAIYILLGKKAEEPESKYDKPTLDLLYKRVENDASGVSASYSGEETLNYIRSRKPGKK